MSPHHQPSSKPPVPWGILVAGVVSLAFIAVAGVLGAFYLDAEKSTPLVTALLGFVGTTIATIVAVGAGVRYVNGRVNGVDERVNRVVDHIDTHVPGPDVVEPGPGQHAPGHDSTLDEDDA